MSADNWRVCPKCKAAHDKDIVARELRLAALYGKVDIAEFLKEKNKLISDSVTRLQETLREDYEIKADEDGEFSVSYGCHCTKCSWGYEYNHTEQVKL